MALEFTNIPDHQGPAVYVLGGTMLENQLKPWCDEVNAATSADVQVFYIDFHSNDGTQIAQFYEISPDKLPAILIIQGDSVYKDWIGVSLPSIQTVTYELNQITGSLRA